MSLIQTQRSYTHHETKEVFNMFQDQDSKSIHLISEATGEPLKNPFYCCAFTYTDVKLKDNTIVKLKVGEFLEVEKGNEPTHTKFFISNRFKKI